MTPRAEVWMKALTSPTEFERRRKSNGVLWCDAVLDARQVRCIAVVPDPQNAFPRARQGEVGLLQGWTLAACVRDAIETSENPRRGIVSLVDVPSQAYGRREEALCLSLALAGAVDAYASARRAGNPSVALILGKALSGGFLAHGYQASRLLALDVADIQIQAMGKEAAARITRRTLEELAEATGKSAPMSYDLESFAGLGILDELVACSNADAPTSADIAEVRARLIVAVGIAATDGAYLEPRLDRKGGIGSRELSRRVHLQMRKEWLAS